MLLILAPDLVFWNLYLRLLPFLLSFGSRNGLTDLSLLFSSWSVVDYVLSLLPVKGFERRPWFPLILTLYETYLLELH
jgi:hypothetical protein